MAAIMHTVNGARHSAEADTSLLSILHKNLGLNGPCFGEAEVEAVLLHHPNQPPLGAAIGNALKQATGPRLRAFPLTLRTASKRRLPGAE